jgi:hypothetical protein
MPKMLEVALGRREVMMRAVFTGHVEAYPAVPLIADAAADEKAVIELGAINLEPRHDRARREGRAHVVQLRPADADIAAKIPSGKFAPVGNAYVDMGTWYGITPYVEGRVLRPEAEAEAGPPRWQDRCRWQPLPRK